MWAQQRVPTRTWICCEWTLLAAAARAAVYPEPWVSPRVVCMQRPMLPPCLTVRHPERETVAAVMQLRLRPTLPPGSHLQMQLLPIHCPHLLVADKSVMLSMIC